jgi:formylglycine-generating enzyme required for sulfatase activity
MRRARSRLLGLLVTGACAALATASCFPDYTFLPAGATPPDGGDGGASGPDATADVAVDSPGADTTVPDVTTAGDAPPDTAPPESGPAEAGPPVDAAPSNTMVTVDGGAFDFVVGQKSVHATLDYSFEIDSEEVTVARFKAWVNAGKPVPCNGAQPCLLDAKTPYKTAMAWDPSWNLLVASNDYLGGADCPDAPSMGTATYAQPNSDTYAVTCVNWAQAAAFCAYDNQKRLPTTTEWYYVATGAGVHAQEYPWGSAMPTCNLAILYGCSYPVAAGTASVQISGVSDLIGDVSEWTWDAVAQSGIAYPPDATDYAGIAFEGGVAARNSFWINSSYTTNAAGLDSVDQAGPEPQYGYPDLGFRCARTQ